MVASVSSKVVLDEVSLDPLVQPCGGRGEVQ